MYSCKGLHVLNIICIGTAFLTPHHSPQRYEFLRAMRLHAEHIYNDQANRRLCNPLTDSSLANHYHWSSIFGIEILSTDLPAYSTEMDKYTYRVQKAAPIGLRPSPPRRQGSTGIRIIGRVCPQRLLRSGRIDRRRHGSRLRHWRAASAPEHINYPGSNR